MLLAAAAHPACYDVMIVYMIGHARTYTYQPIRAMHCFRDVVSDVNLHLSLLLIPNIPLMLHHFLLVAVRTGAPPCTWTSGCPLLSLDGIGWIWELQMKLQIFDFTQRS